MAKVDMHVHSKHSERPSEWFLQRLGTRESYTDPETIYREALKQGMDFVTITDHNTIEGALILKERYPECVFTGLEATTYFPETGCKIHLLIYGLNEVQFAMIDRLRPDIYQLRDYVREQGLAHSVAHATYSINNRLTFEQIDKLLLLFDSFEAINGSRSRYANEVFQRALAALTSEHIERLRRKHGIEPFSDTAWRKALTGGTDDHGGLFIGKTYTEAHADNPPEFLQTLQRKETMAAGRHNDYRGLAFSLYKIAYDFSCSHKTAITSPLLSSINKLLFDKNSLTFKNRLILKKVSCSRSPGKIESLIAELITTLQKKHVGSPDELLEYIHDTVAQLCDELFKQLATTVEASLSRGNIAELVQCIASALPGLFLSLPFFTSLNILNESRSLLDRLDAEYGGHNPQIAKKVLWINGGTCKEFSDTVWQHYSRLRGHSRVQGIMLECSTDTATEQISGHDTLRLPPVYTLELPFGTRRLLLIPSLLNAVKRICETSPDEIVVTSPGPMGLLGLLAAKLLHVPCVGVSDTGVPADSNNGEAAQLIKGYAQWFYSMMDCRIEGFPAAALLHPCIPLPAPPQSGLPFMAPPTGDASLIAMHNAGSM